VVEEKGIYSIEEFLVSRRLMYWQVYQHKTVLSAEMTLIKILERAKWIYKKNPESIDAGERLNKLLFKDIDSPERTHIEIFCELDDSDVINAIKSWKGHADTVISTLCKALLNRKLLKLRLQSEPIQESEIKTKRENVSAQLGISMDDASCLVFNGEAENNLYDPNNERINILFKDGTVRDISQVDSPLIHQNLSGPVKKFYICFYQ